MDNRVGMVGKSLETDALTVAGTLSPFSDLVNSSAILVSHNFEKVEVMIPLVAYWFI